MNSVCLSPYRIQEESTSSRASCDCNKDAGMKCVCAAALCCSRCSSSCWLGWSRICSQRASSRAGAKLLCKFLLLGLKLLLIGLGPSCSASKVQQEHALPVPACARPRHASTLHPPGNLEQCQRCRLMRPPQAWYISSAPCAGTHKGNIFSQIAAALAPCQDVSVPLLQGRASDHRQLLPASADAWLHSVQLMCSEALWCKC